jgi:hypothetical protein
MTALLRRLQPHAELQPGPVDGIEVEVHPLTGSGIGLRFHLSGDTNLIRIPEALPAARTDGLWQHTCFEVFIRSPHALTYHEFNFSPSGQWQAYAFTDYRIGGLLTLTRAPVIECLSAPNGLTLQTTLQAADLPEGARLRLGLSAVIETCDGAISYWALRHPPGKPDFHHPDTFDLELDLT